MIFIFKTSVRTEMQLKKLKPHIDSMLPGVKWNFDLEDIDKVFRVDCEENSVGQIINLLNTHSYSCEELE